ncbi:MAG: hypothetical protein HYX67_10345 [Candidatus Melainabacteria bacterium]|nr:hypothetical protein [Candidatus Melainabacteria bacterium]
MADVSKIQGPSGSPEKPGKEKSANVDADKFREAMRRRVTEVSQIDPDEQKKRKRPEETEEENIEAPQAPTTPPELVTPFSLEQEKQKISPLEMQKGGPGISPTESAKPMPKGPVESSFYSAPSPSEMADDSGVLEEPSFEEPAVTGQEQPASPPPQQDPQSTPPQPSWAPEGQSPVEAGPPQTEQEQQQEQKESSSKEKSRQKQRPLSPLPEKKLTADELSKHEPKKAEDTKTFFEQMGKGGEKGSGQGEKKAEELAEEEAEALGTGAPGQPTPFSQAMEEGKTKKVEDKDAAGLTGAPVSGEPLVAPQALPAPESLPAYTTLTPQVMEMFDRMVGVMTVMNMTGMTETVITLNSPQFASSVFFGSQIIIQEFSTAPKAFNIQLNGSQQAVALFQGNTDDLMAAFQAGNYNFRVNRLETGYLTERPLFKRKEKAGGKEKETGDNPQ